MLYLELPILLAVSSDSTGAISETLINTTTSPINVIYTFKLYYYGAVNTQNIQVTVNPDSKADYTYIKNLLCAPAYIDSNNINKIHYPNTNSNYEWFVNNSSLGVSNYFPGYTILNNGDSIAIKMISASLYGCRKDSITYNFYTVKTPAVSFSKSIDSGCGPLIVTFQNNTFPKNASNFSWDFGNGQTSNLETPPPITFNADLSNRRVDTTYYITLKATTECDTISYRDSVIVFPKPKALFQPDSTIGCSVFKFKAFNNSTAKRNTYYWDFGDSTYVTDTIGGLINHNFYTPKTDTFNVKLKAVNICGVDSFEVKVVVYPNTIVPKLIVDGNFIYGCTPSLVKFVNNSIGANKFTINFGDGSLPYISTKSLDTIYHTYTTSGLFQVTMRAENLCTDSIVSFAIQVYQKPEAKFTIPSNQFCKNQIINFLNTSDTSLYFQWTLWRWKWFNTEISNL